MMTFEISWHPCVAMYNSGLREEVLHLEYTITSTRHPYEMFHELTPNLLMIQANPVNIWALIENLAGWAIQIEGQWDREDGKGAALQ